MTGSKTTPYRRPLRNLLFLLVFLIVVLGGGIAIGFANTPGDWYADLGKPPFNPPSWVFGPVWTLLYVCIALAGWRIWSVAPNGISMRLWIAQLVVNWMWSPVFFTLHMLWLALAICLLMWGLILAVILTAWRCDRLAAWLMVPYLLWVSFAALLNGAVAWLN